MRGKITDAETHQPLANASVQLLPSGTGTTSSPQGTFRFDNLPVGRYTVAVTYLGYQTLTIPEVLVESGKEQVLDIDLSPSSTQLQEATVRTTRPVAVNSIQPITIEQTLRYAATYLDPARVTTSFPGVAVSNDQANGLVVRGNSPNGMQWRLEGVEIVNPNHLTNAGTFSDRPTQTAGGVNILSTQLLGTSYFLSGAFPSEYGNALSGVLDMKLRTGNNEKREFTAQAGLIGFDVAAEGPFSKKSKASYLVNYRYSFTGLLGAMGVDFGGEDIRYQDLSFNITLPTRRTGEFTFFGVGGISSNLFKAKPDTTEWVVQKDGFDIDYTNKMGALGMTHTVTLGPNTGLRTVAVASALSSRRDGYVHSIYDPAERFHIEQDAVDKTRLSLSTALSHRLGEKNLLRSGLFLTYQDDRILSVGRVLAEGQLQGLVIQPYLSWRWNITPTLTSEAGLHYLSYTYNKTNSLEPRASLQWQATPRQVLSLSYGLHSQLQQPQVYLAIKNSNTQLIERPNRYLDLTKAHHLVAGYQYHLTNTSSLKVEAYWQELYDVPVVTLSPAVSYRVMPSFSTLNLVETYVDQELKNAGTGRNVGLEVSYQKFLTDSYYMLVSGSLYNSTYVGGDGIRRSTRYNGNHTFSFTGGKEFKTTRNGMWGINTRILWFGGFRDTPINVEASRSELATVYEVNNAFTVKLKDYFRPDLRIYWKKNKEKYNRTLALDIQNVSGTQNESFRYYDVWQRQVVQQYQLGLVPVLSYRWEF
ncbi:TonB-dependent receptor [Telluribacter sp. SYSU D00476]|uniref:TonB-dependent receptor n=1 Tax=Telluribacter sp. SYSU D00476 TaxID=2811430 RepID=UPI001FF2CE6A|nr:TonB-dependent receptor [Telluribacter sp. SYSU D00476]